MDAITYFCAENQYQANVTSKIYVKRHNMCWSLTTNDNENAASQRFAEAKSIMMAKAAFAID
jgi:hypothetical protein